MADPIYEVEELDDAPAIGDENKPSPKGGKLTAEAPEEDDEANADVEDDADADDDETEGDEESEGDEDEQSDEELVDVTLQDGRVVKVPPEVRDGIMKNADYTQKSQANAEYRRQLEAATQAFQAQQEIQSQVWNESVQLHNIEAQLQQYQNVDWDALQDEDMMEAQKHWRKFEQLKDARANLANQLGYKQQMAAQIAQENDRLARERYHADLKTAFPDWSNDMDVKLSDYARRSGYTDQELASVRDARNVKILHKAMLYDEMQEKLKAQKAKAKRPIGRDTVAKPLANPAKGRAPARTGLSDKDSAEEWMRKRNKQLFGKSR